MQGLNQALEASQAFRGAAQTALAERLAARHYDAEQRAAHGFAWIATSVAALEAVLGWTDAGNGANPLDDVVARLAFVEIIGQLSGGLPMGQNELLRPSDLHISAAGRALTDASSPEFCTEPRLRVTLVADGAAEPAMGCAISASCVFLL